MYDRSKTIGASDAVYIQSGQWAELYDRKRTSEPPEWGLAAEIGKRLERFNLELFKHETGREVLIKNSWQQNPITYRLNKWCKYLPDGLTIDQDEGAAEDGLAAEPRIPIEAKCINMMWKPHNLLTKYMPQLQHAMRVMGAPYCWFSVIYLNTKYECTKIPYDPPYDNALFEKEELFAWMLKTGTRPPQKKGRKWV